MSYIFFGTPAIAAIVLERLMRAGYVPSAVITNPDRPVGRKKIITPPPVKQLIFDHRPPIKIFQPENLLTIGDQLLKIRPEVGILSAYGKIISKEIIEVFPKGIIVVHPSLLPKYRGATPVQSALLAGEKETGTCLIRMDEKVDHGPILACAKINIDNKDAYDSLSQKLFNLGADLLLETLPWYLAGKVRSKPQNHKQATYTKKFTSEDGFINLEKDKPLEIWRKVRALNPEPGVWTIINDDHPTFAKASVGKRMKILEADFKNGKLILKKIQFEGERPKII